jgi:hypothetical protein
LSRLVDCDLFSVVIVNGCSRASIPFTISELVWGIAVLGTTSWPGRLRCKGASRGDRILLTTVVVVSFTRAIL